jgi:predicted dehydrogenase
VNNKKLRIGVVGVGHLGEYHVQKYKTLPLVDLIGVVDTNTARAEEIGQRYDIKIFSHYGEILDLVDAVSLAVPTEAHFDVAKEILSHGIHLLVEKPITYKIEMADTLIQMARDRDLVLRVGLVERFNPAIMKMESMLNKPILIDAHRMNLFTTRGTDVDVVLDLMIHDLDIILHIVPSNVQEVHAVGMSVITPKTDVANARLIFENGTVANLTASRVSHKTIRKIRVFQPDSLLEADCFKRELGVIRLDNGGRGPDGLSPAAPDKTSFPDSDPLSNQIRSFVDAVMNQSKKALNSWDERKALKIALGIIGQITGGCKNFKPLC